MEVFVRLTRSIVFIVLPPYWTTLILHSTYVEAELLWILQSRGSEWCVTLEDGVIRSGAAFSSVTIVCTLELKVESSDASLSLYRQSTAFMISTLRMLTSWHYSFDDVIRVLQNRDHLEHHLICSEVDRTRTHYSAPLHPRTSTHSEAVSFKLRRTPCLTTLEKRNGLRSGMNDLTGHTVDF